jgi:hypothetical protein
MANLTKQLDENLAHLAWSLWTELGVAGFERKHKDCSVSPEELIILTSALSEFDPRLRDEALDWCSRYHRFISPIRLQFLAKKYKTYISESFSTFSATLNTFADMRTKWVTLTKAAPLKFSPSGKSIIRNFEAPSMIHLRLRAFLGIGARADIITFLLIDDSKGFSSSDLLEIGYSKRRIAGILNELSMTGILSESHVRNQLHYDFIKHNEFIKLIGDMPKKKVHWNRILSILLPIRACLHDVEGSPLGVRTIDLLNLLKELSPNLKKLGLKPPTFQDDLEAYWKSATKWILDFSSSL